MIKIFFLGTPEIANPSLRALFAHDQVEIVGVGVFGDKPVGRKKILTPCPVKVLALELGLPIYEIHTKQDLVAISQSLDFDLGIVIAFGLIFPAEVLAQHFFVNVHFSLLPAWRGASPVQSAILAGKTESGITWQRMVYDLDAGNILLQKKYDITGKNTLELWNEFADKTAESWSEFFIELRGESEEMNKKKILNQVQDDNQLKLEKLNFYNGIKQDETKATFCGKFQKSDGLVNPKTESAEIMYRKFLAFTPWPGIYVETKYGNVKILDCVLASGELRDESLETKDRFELKCKEGILLLGKVQLAGKKPMAVQELLNGRSDVFSE